eukprot:m.211155 g.211155  ORF g.211155 m.211155 type:complete len:73 (-) comp15056_c0_seq2:902-1120(-)
MRRVEDGAKNRNGNPISITSVIITLFVYHMHSEVAKQRQPVVFFINLKEQSKVHVSRGTSKQQAATNRRRAQ